MKEKFHSKTEKEIGFDVPISKAQLQKLLDRAREEGREEGINAVLYPKFKRGKNGTLKREGWVDKSKLTTK